jgi:hypothetical protein
VAATATAAPRRKAAAAPVKRTARTAKAAPRRKIVKKAAASTRTQKRK